MAIRVHLRSCVRSAVVVVLAACGFHAVTQAAAAEPDRVSLSEQTISWSTVKYATNADNSFIDGSFDKTTIVGRTLKAHVLENRYLKVTLVPEFGGRILSIIYKPTGHEQLYRTEVGVPYGMKAGVFYYDWLMVYGGIFPTFPDAEHGRTWLKRWDFKVVKATDWRSDGGDVAQGRCRLCRRAKTIRPGRDGHRGDLLCDAEGRSRRARCAHGADKIRTIPRSITNTGPARRWRRDRTRTIPERPAAPRSSRRSRPTGRRIGRPTCPRATHPRARAGSRSTNCASSGTGRRWASPMRRRTCRVEISGA